MEGREKNAEAQVLAHWGRFSAFIMEASLAS